MRGKIIKILILIACIFLVFASASFVLTRVYKDQIKTYAISEINKQINVKVHVGSIDLSIFRKFPYISVVLTNSIASSPRGFYKDQFAINTDTLFYASKIFLQFNVFDILKQDPGIRRIHILNGKLNLLTDLNGMKNYLIFKEKKKDAKSSSFELHSMKVTGFLVNYIDLPGKITSTTLLEDLTMKGRFTGSKFSAELDSDFETGSFRNSSVSFSKPLKTSVRLQLEVADSVYSIKNGVVRLNDVSFGLNGRVRNAGIPVLDLNLQGEDIEINSVIESFPFSIKNAGRIRTSGKMSITASVSGQAGKKKFPSVKASFEFNNGKFAIPEKSFRLEDVNLKGTYSNGHGLDIMKGTVKLSEYSFTGGRNKISGNLEFENFNNPVARIYLSGSFEARILSDIIRVQGFNFEKGVFHPDLTIRTILSGLKDFNSGCISSLGFYGSTRLDSVSGYLPGVNDHVTNMNGKIRFDGDTWFPQVGAKTATSDLYIDLEADHVLGFFLYRNSSLWLKGDLQSEKFDLKKFIPEKEPGGQTASIFPRKLYMKLNYTGTELEYGKFKATNISSHLEYQPGILLYSGLVMDAMKGQVRSSGTISEDQSGRITFNSISNLQKTDIKDLFFTFNNFGQTFITDKNLRGLISGKLESSIVFDPKLNPDFSTLAASSDIVISNGELVNFEPVKELSRFVALSELEHIRFSTLQNSVLIRESKVYIPQMDINSSAFNITTSGVHHFNNYFEYKVKVQLSQLLARKAVVRSEFEEVTNDNQGASLFLSITGTPDNFKVKYDRKEALNKVRNDLKKEKSVLKSILREEFGTDDSGKEIITPKEQPVDRFTFEIEEKAGEQPAVKKKAIKKADQQDFEFILD